MGGRDWYRYLPKSYHTPPYFGANTQLFNASALVVVKCRVCRALVEWTEVDIAAHAGFHAPEL